MKKLTILMLGLVLASMVYAANTDLTNTGTPDNVFRVPRLGPAPVIAGHRAPAVLVDTLRMDVLNPTGYTWGIAYDWERDGIWVTQWNSSYNKMYCIEKTSPTTKIDSVTLGSGVPSYRLGIGYGGSNTMYMAAYSSSIYAINMTNGTGSVYRSLPWSGCEGYDFNLASDANYACDWTANACAWAQPAQSGTWTTWSVNPYPSGMTGGYHATAQPTKLFMVDESGPPCNLFQYAMTNGVPNTTPESTWTLDASMTGASTADCAFDGQYVYVLDQSGPDMIWVFDVGIQTDDTIRWTFETGLQGWTHTAATVFPNGWGVATSALHAGFVCPTPGDSSLWFDDDAAGSGAPSLNDTAFSPVIVPNPATTHKLKWGVAYNYLTASEVFEVGVKYFNGTDWVVRRMMDYTADVAGRWDSCFVDSLLSYPRLQVYAYYYDGGGWNWYGAIDNITINGELYVAQHDVRTTAIVAPASRIPPNSVQTPTATFRNTGNNNEDFSVNFVIDSLGTVIYTNSVNLVGIVPAAETTIVFPNWTSGQGDGFIYNLTAFTNLVGDVNPANDTIRATTSISTVSNWIQCADMPTAEECQATAYDPEHDKVYTFGGYHGDNTCQNYTYQYDPVANTWTTLAPMPYAVDWLDASYVNGKFYIMGGFDSATPHNYCLIYDVAGNSWTQGANMPQARIAGGQMIYNDSLIYMVGGYNGSAPTTNVQIYNTYTNTWTVGTALPQADMMCGVAMTGDTLWLVGGYSGACYNNLYYGVINPTTNETITWSTGSVLAVPNFNNGATMMTRNGSWYLYIVGGFENASTITNHAWEYNVGADAWNALPDYPFTVTRNDILVAREGHNEIYVCGGDNSGGWTENAQVWKLQWTVPPGAEEKPGTTPKAIFGFAPNMNPIKNRATLSYATPVAGNVSLKVYDGMGRLVKVLVQGVQPAGSKTVTWNLTDDAGRSLMSGVYFVRLESNGQTMSQKLVVVK